MISHPAFTVEPWSLRETALDLESGVAAGTPGKVILANGFNWLRYRVAFVNGIEVGDLDQRNIAPIGRTAKRLARAAKRA